MSSGGDPPSRSPFESLAWLFAPADDPGDCRIVEADLRWNLDPASFEGAISAIWGRPASRHAQPAQMVRFALAREIALRRVGGRSTDGLRAWEVHRLPPIGRSGRWRGAIRSATRSGALVRLGRERPGRRVVDEVAALARNRDSRPVAVRASGDGSALARIVVAGEEAQLRLGTVGGLKDSRRNVAALELLGLARVAHVPHLRDHGETLDVRWSTESHLPGAPVRRLPSSLLADVVAWSAALPRSGGPATAVEERLGVVAAAFPRWRAEIGQALRQLRPIARSVPGVVEHGDLWVGNLLAMDGRLTGVVDWDTWHPSGMPAADLLHLVAVERHTATGLELGELWLERPWADETFRAATDPYWRAIGVEPTEELLWAVGVDWWAAHVAAGLRRGRRPADDRAWVARNVDNVAPALGRPASRRSRRVLTTSRAP